MALVCHAATTALHRWVVSEMCVEDYWPALRSLFGMSLMQAVEQDLNKPEQRCNASKQFRESVHRHGRLLQLSWARPIGEVWLVSRVTSHVSKGSAQCRSWYSDRPDFNVKLA